MSRSTWPKRVRRDRGTATVEFALLLPVLTTFILGVLTTGVALNPQQQMAHAVRESAWHGAALRAD